jgi:hypothetical protein
MGDPQLVIAAKRLAIVLRSAFGTSKKQTVLSMVIDIMAAVHKELSSAADKADKEVLSNHQAIFIARRMSY